MPRWTDARQTFYRFAGGPHDGEEIRRQRPARHPTYMDNDLELITTPVGDRIVGGRSRIRSCYVRGPETRDEDGRRIITYRYITVVEENHTR